MNTAKVLNLVLHKEAGIKDIVKKISGGAVTLSGDAINALKTLAVVAPIGAGVGAGMLASKLDSPSEEELESEQQKLYDMELKEFRLELQRRKKVQEMQDKIERKKERSLHL
jgi:hypothetical protein